MIAANEMTLAGGRVAALSWGAESAPTWLALHGWLDNAASFSRLAPLLVERLGIRVVAIDFAGHGLSHRYPAGIDYAIWDYVHDVLDAMSTLDLQRTSLLAHSMGAGVSCLVAAALPERIERLVLIDGIGTLFTPANETAAQLRKGILGHRRRASPPPRYPDLATAVAARVSGGVTPIDAETAEPLVKRNLECDEQGGWRLRTDGRLLRPSMVRFCPEQVLALLGAIESSVLLVEGTQGILAEREFAQRARGVIRHLQRCVLAGGHHLHLEPSAVAAVADTIVRHIETTVTGETYG